MANLKRERHAHSALVATQSDSSSKDNAALNEANQHKFILRMCRAIPVPLSIFEMPPPPESKWQTDARHSKVLANGKSVCRQIAMICERQRRRAS